MKISIQRKICAALMALFVVAWAAAPAQAAEEPPYEADPTFSLLGNCETPPVDPVPDPGCPYSAPPAGPSGRFEQPRPVAVDRHGNQYVVSWAGGDDSKGRVDVFDDEGRFITEFKVPAAKTAAVDSKGNLYLFKELGDVVRYEPTEYKPEEGKIAYGNAPVLVASGSFQGSVAVDPKNDQVLIARDGINVYKSAAEGNGLIETYKPAGLSWTEAMVVDGQRRRIYVSFCAKSNEECGIKVLNADKPTEVLETIDGKTVPAGKFISFSGRLPVAADEETGDFVIADPEAKMIYRFSEGYEFLSQQEFKDLVIGLQIAISNGTREPAAEECDYPNPAPPAGDACNRHYLFVTVFKSAGRLTAFKPSNQGTPVVESVSVSGIGETEAELKATIDPRGLETEYHFEITTEAGWEANGFTGATTIPGGTIAANSLASEVSVFATGLTPGESYRFRAVAENSLGKAEEEGQNEAGFTTYDDAPTSSGCPNEAFRVGPSALLPDCRAYELVTPADTNGHAPRGTSVLGSVFSTLQTSPSGGTVSFRIEGGALPGDPGVGGFNGGDPYLAKRGASGWSNELAGPSGAEATKTAPASVSPDQNYSFWRSLGEGPLAPEGGTIYSEYFRYPDGHSELIGRGSEGTEAVAAGKLITEDATHVIFQTINLGPRKAVKLEPNAPPEGTTAVYDRTRDPVSGDEETHVVSLLPGDETPKEGENASYQGASADGEGIAFAISTSPFEIGDVYLRVGNETTYLVGENVEFAGISEGGERIFYLQGGNLKALDTTTATPEVIDFTTTGNAIPVNVSSDGTRAYFVSTSVLGGANPEGDTAQGGAQNLYLSEEGTISFVATVTSRDVKGEIPPLEANFTDGLGLWTDVAASQPARDPSRLNPDGSVLLFQSRAEITGYPESEFAQIYRYDAGAGDLRCVSCIPTGTPATGGARLESYTFDTISDPEPFSPYGFVPNLNPEGTRVFFDSEEALVSGDTDEVTDVYEWEAQGVGSCDRPQGCVYLISSGQSEVANFLYGHSVSGNDVFFTTGDRLTGWDSAGGAISIYDARVNGGFPEPEPAIDCSADGCRPNVTPAPVLPAPATPARGADDQVPPKKAKTCPKGKRKVKKNGKVRCVKKKKHKSGKAKNRASANRGAGK